MSDVYALVSYLNLSQTTEIFLVSVQKLQIILAACPLRRHFRPKNEFFLVRGYII